MEIYLNLQSYNNALGKGILVTHMEIILLDR
jgi:hypothetical protein